LEKIFHLSVFQTNQSPPSFAQNQAPQVYKSFSDQ